MRIENPLAPTATVFVFLAQAPKKTADGTTKKRKEDKTKAELEWLVEFGHCFAALASCT